MYIIKIDDKCLTTDNMLVTMCSASMKMRFETYDEAYNYLCTLVAKAKKYANCLSKATDHDRTILYNMTLQHHSGEDIMHIVNALLDGTTTHDLNIEIIPESN